MTDFKPWIDFIQLVMIPGFAYGIKLLWDIREHLVRLNGRMDTCEALREQHDNVEKEKHRMCELRLHGVEQELFSHRK